VRAVRGHRTECDQCMRRVELAVASSELERRRGFHLDHPHGSSYKPQHLNVEEVAGNRGLIDEAIEAMTTDDVVGGNDG
jgi:hypothetical protein